MPYINCCTFGTRVLITEHVQNKLCYFGRRKPDTTKRLPGLKNFTYQERLNRLNLVSLELRRLHMDLIMCYKIVIGLVNVQSLQCINFLQLSPSPHTRGHAYKLYKQRSCGITYFGNRVINVWNSSQRHSRSHLVKQV